MARLPRSVLPSAGIYHVTSRGVARCEIFRDDDDRRQLILLLERVARRSGWRCPAYTLMSNHFHLLIDAQLTAVSAGMSVLNGIHAQAFNDRYERVGHLFQGRFDARVLRDDEHLENACEYVWNNAVRAGLCETAADWPWNGSI